MVYTAAITTAKGSWTKGKPLRTVLPVTKGLVYKVEFDFPPGSAGLTGIAIFDGGFQVWPSSVTNWFTGDNIVISFDDIYLKESAPYRFNILTYNDDTAYDHLVNIRIGLVSQEIFMARFVPSLSYKYFSDMLQQLAASQLIMQTKQRQEVIDKPFTWLSEDQE